MSESRKTLVRNLFDDLIKCLAGSVSRHRLRLYAVRRGSVIVDVLILPASGPEAALGSSNGVEAGGESEGLRGDEELSPAQAAAWLTEQAERRGATMAKGLTTRHVISITCPAWALLQGSWRPPPPPPHPAPAVVHATQHQMPIAQAYTRASKLPRHFTILKGCRRVADPEDQEGKIADGGALPPLGCIDILVSEARNLHVPHGFRSILNLSGLAPYATVRIQGEEHDVLRTSTVTKAVLSNYSRKQCDPVLNQTCRFGGIIRPAGSVLGTVIVSFHDENTGDPEGAGLLGCFQIPLERVLQSGGQEEGWYELMTSDLRQPAAGQNPSMRCCAYVRVKVNPVGPGHADQWKKEYTIQTSELQRRLFEDMERQAAEEEAK